MTITTYEVTLSNRPKFTGTTIQTVRATSEEHVRTMFDERKIICITPIKKVKANISIIRDKGLLV